MIRKSALILISVTVLLFVAGFFLIDDLLLEDTAETLLESALDTKVAMHGLDLDPLNMSVTMGGLTIQDKEEPWKNMAQTGAANFDILGMQLFAKKVIIQSLVLKDLTLGAPRPGESKEDYAPKKKKKSTTTAPAPTTTATAPTTAPADTEEAAAKDEDSSWGLGSMSEDVNFDALLADMGAEGLADPKKLKSMIELEKVKKESAERQKYWDKILADDRLTNEDIRLQKEGKRIKKGVYKTPKQIKKGLKDLQKLSTDTNAYIKKVRDLKNKFNKDLKATQDGVNRVQRLSKEDAKAIQNLANIGNMDFSKMGKALFGSALVDKIEMVLGYIKTAREVISSGKPEDIKKRKDGRNFSFPVTGVAYPDFLIKQSTFSGKMLDDSGKVTHSLTGQAKDITTNADVVGRPATLNSMVTQISNGAVYKIEAVFDHRAGTFKDSFNIIGDNVKMDDIKLRAPSEGSSMPYKITSPHSDVKILVTMNEDQLNAEVIIHSKDVTFVFAGKAGSRSNQELRDAISEIKDFKINASISGKMSALKFKLDSDLDNKLSAQFTKAMKKKTKAAQDKVQGDINKSLNQAGLQSLTPDSSGQGKLNGLEKSGNRTQALINSKKKEIQKQAQNKVKKQALDKLKGLFGR